MPPEFDISSFMYLGGVALIVGIVQIFKAWISDTRYYLPIAVVVGIALNLLIGWYLGVDLAASTIMGLIAGMAAGGAYSYAATLKEGNLADKDNR
jgi:hypothetical protein